MSNPDAARTTRPRSNECFHGHHDSCEPCQCECHPSELAAREQEKEQCEWPGCHEPALCSSGNYGNKLVCSKHFMITNGPQSDSHTEKERGLREMAYAYLTARNPDGSYAHQIGVLEDLIVDFALHAETHLRQQVQELQTSLRLENEAHMRTQTRREDAEARVVESQQTAELYARNALDAATRSDELKARVAMLEADVATWRNECHGEHGYAAQLEAENARLRAALKAARQFLIPGIGRGPAINGWQNAVDLVNEVLPWDDES